MESSTIYMLKTYPPRSFFRMVSIFKTYEKLFNSTTNFTHKLAVPKRQTCWFCFVQRDVRRIVLVTDQWPPLRCSDDKESWLGCNIFRPSSPKHPTPSKRVGKQFMENEKVSLIHLSPPLQIAILKRVCVGGQGPTGRGFSLRDGTGRVIAKKFGYRDGSGRVVGKF